MALEANISIATLAGDLHLTFRRGSTFVFLGANGAGKTRLGVLLDQYFSTQNVEVHRVSAHRSLSLNPNVVPPSYEVASKRLLYGTDEGQPHHKHGNRFHGRPEIAMLSDFDHVLSALYAENNDVSIAYRQQNLNNPTNLVAPTPAIIDRVKDIWARLLPHRDLVVQSGNVKTRVPGGAEYSAADMSDGERVIFYLIAQALLAKPDTLLIFDEPELHINRSILAKIWDEIESARPDCGFIYITHDVDFAASRHAAQRYALRSYQKEPTEAWDIALIPDDDDLPDDVVAAIIGSRRPVLFVEGDGGSLDAALYRRAFSDKTVIPVGSCDTVIHSVRTFVARRHLHHVGCAGLVDADGRGLEEVTYLEGLGVYCLPVSEVENLLLLPNVFRAIATALHFSAEETDQKMEAIKDRVFQAALSEVDAVAIRQTKRRLDTRMKKIGLSATDRPSLEQEFASELGEIRVGEMFDEAKAALSASIAQRDYEAVLRAYDNKGLLSEAARQLNMTQRALEEFLGRVLRSEQQPEIHDALVAVLPTVQPRP